MSVGAKLNKDALMKCYYIQLIFSFKKFWHSMTKQESKIASPLNKRNRCHKHELVNRIKVYHSFTQFLFKTAEVFQSHCFYGLKSFIEISEKVLQGITFFHSFWSDASLPLLQPLLCTASEMAEIRSLQFSLAYREDKLLCWNISNHKKHR